MTDKPLFEVVLKQRHFAFNSFDEIDAWLKRESEEQVWFRPNLDAGSEFNQLRDSFRSQMTNARNTLKEWRADGNAKRGEALQNLLVRTFQEKRIVLSDDPMAIIAKSVGDKAGQSLPSERMRSSWGFRVE